MVAVVAVVAAAEVADAGREKSPIFRFEVAGQADQIHLISGVLASQNQMFVGSPRLNPAATQLGWNTGESRRGSEGDY